MDNMRTEPETATLPAVLRRCKRGAWHGLAGAIALLGVACTSSGAGGETDGHAADADAALEPADSGGAGPNRVRDGSVDEVHGDAHTGGDAGAPKECRAQEAKASVTLNGLLDELVNLDRFASLPTPSYTAQLASSFDRNSVDAKPGDDRWFANGDAAKLPAELPLVLLDTTGPGVLTRIWSANPSGTLRIYLDGKADPVVEAPMKMLLSGRIEPFKAPFAFESGGGYNLYFPIPFQKHCVVTVVSDAATLYYQVNHRRYQEGTSVEPFSAGAVVAAECERHRIAMRLNSVDSSPPPAESGHASFVLGTTAPETSEWQTLASPGGTAIQELRAVVEPEHMAVLREAILRIEFDGEETVQVPFGDFFGTAGGAQPVHSLPLGATPQANAFVSRWPMPFAREAKISLASASGARVSARFDVTLVPRPWDERSLLFYAQWHPPEWQKTKPTHDWNLTTLRGNGVYVGCLLNLINTTPSWWGEGDEKIFVDEEAFPSAFGTGTEDYFGYAWCSNERFTTPFIGQTLSGTRQNWGSVSLYRFLLLDAMPFTRSFRFDLEVNHWDDASADVEYDSIVYFYARPGAQATPVATDPQVYRIPRPTTSEPIDLPSAPYACGSG